MRLPASSSLAPAVATPAVQPTSAQPLDALPERFHGLDAVRAFALLLGILFHGVESLVSYMPPYLWAVKDAQSSVVIDAFFYQAHVFRMQAFFLVAGFFAHQLYHRRGARGFLTHRLQRIGLPLVVFWPVVYLLIHLLWTWGYQRMGYLAQNPATASLSYWQVVGTGLTSLQWLNNGFPWTHLWFLYLLLWFCAGVLLVRPLVTKADPRERIRRGVDNLVGWSTRRWWGSLLLSLFTMVPMWGMKNGFGVDTPDYGLLPKAAPFLVYGFYFTLGWFVHRQKEVLRGLLKYWPQNLLLSLLLIGLLTFSFLSVAYHPPQPGQAAPTALQQAIPFVFASLYGMAAMTGVWAFIGLMMAFFSHPSPAIRYLSDASYWCYLIHLPVVVFFQVLVVPYPWHWAFKLTLILLPSFAILLLTYHYLVRNTWLGKFLNGRSDSKAAAK